MTAADGPTDSENDTNNQIRMWLTTTGCVLAGILLGLFYALWIFYILGYGVIAAVIVGGCICLVVAILTAISQLGRTTGAVLLASCGLRSSHCAVYALLASLALAGPLSNMATNGEHLKRSIHCLKGIAHNQSEAFTQLLRKPYLAVGEKLEEVQSEWDSAAMPIQRSIDDLHDKYLTARDQVNQLKTRINDMNMFQGCMEKVRTVHTACTEDLNVIKRKCDDITGGGSSEGHGTAQSIRCRVFGGADCNTRARRIKRNPFSQICAAFDLTPTCSRFTGNAFEICERLKPPGIFEQFTHQSGAVEKAFQYFSNITHFKIARKLDRSLQEKLGISQKNVNETALLSKPKTVSLLRFVRPVLVLLEIFACCSILYPIYIALEYIHDFVVKDKFDNFYITPAFIDFDDNSGGKLLPLKGSEIRKYVFIHGFVVEWRNVIINAILLLVNVVTVFVLFMFDNLFTWGLAILRSYVSRVDLKFLELSEYDVVGSGPLSDVFRSFLSGFSDLLDPTLGDQIQKCFTEPHQLPVYYFVVACISYFIVCICVVFSNQSYRWRNMVTSLSYQARHAERVAWLHGKIVKDRSKGGTLARKEVLAKTGERHRAANFTVVSKKFIETERKCLLCGRKKEIVSCDKCKSVYCTECVEHHSNQCVVCDDALGKGPVKRTQQSLP